MGSRPGKRTNKTVSQARLFRIKAGQGVAHCKPAAANMEQYAKLPRNSVDGHRPAEVALRRPPSPSAARAAGAADGGHPFQAGRLEQQVVNAEWDVRLGDGSKQKGGCRRGSGNALIA